MLDLERWEGPGRLEFRIDGLTVLEVGVEVSAGVDGAWFAVERWVPTDAEREALDFLAGYGSIFVLCRPCGEELPVKAETAPGGLRLSAGPAAPPTP